MKDQILGCLLGLACGDAMGMPTEFLTREQIWKTYGMVDDFIHPDSKHIHAGMPAGRITDDTGQTLALARAAIQHGGSLNLEVVAEALLTWMDSLGNDFEKVVGPSTKRALNRLLEGVSPQDAGLEGRTNGAAMRAPIAGLLNPGNMRAALHTAYLISIPTHGTNVAVAGSGAVACAVAQALVPGVSLESIIHAGMEGAESGAKLGKIVWGTSLVNRIKLAIQLVENAHSEEEAHKALFDYVGVDLLVSESVATAFGIVKLAKGEPVKAITLSANLGGDTDTIGTISGAICGAWKGSGTFPLEWQELLNSVNQFDLNQLADQLTSVVNN